MREFCLGRASIRIPRHSASDCAHSRFTTAFLLDLSYFQRPLPGTFPFRSVTDVLSDRPTTIHDESAWLIDQDTPSASNRIRPVEIVQAKGKQELNDRLRPFKCFVLFGHQPENVVNGFAQLHRESSTNFALRLDESLDCCQRVFNTSPPDICLQFARPNTVYRFICFTVFQKKMVSILYFNNLQNLWRSAFTLVSFTGLESPNRSINSSAPQPKPKSARFPQLCPY